MAAQQDIIDQLIDYIDKAILKNSVSNRHVATVLSFLNEKLKEIDNGKYIRKDQPDSTDFFLEANGGLVIRKQEIVEAAFLSLIEEYEDSLVEELNINGEVRTLGELTNVNADVDTATPGSLFVKGDNWEAVPPVISTLTDYDNMLMPVFHKVLGKWIFISVSSISGGVTPTLELVLDTGILDVNKLA